MPALPDGGDGAAVHELGDPRLPARGMAHAVVPKQRVVDAQPTERSRPLLQTRVKVGVVPAVASEALVVAADGLKVVAAQQHDAVEVPRVLVRRALPVARVEAAGRHAMRREEVGVQPRVRIDLQQHRAACKLSRQVVGAREVPLALERRVHQAQPRVARQPLAHCRGRAPVDQDQLVEAAHAQPRRQHPQQRLGPVAHACDERVSDGANALRTEADLAHARCQPAQPAIALARVPGGRARLPSLGGGAEVAGGRQGPPRTLEREPDEQQRKHELPHSEGDGRHMMKDRAPRSRRPARRASRVVYARPQSSVSCHLVSIALGL